MTTFLLLWAAVTTAFVLLLIACAVALIDVSLAARDERHRVY